MDHSIFKRSLYGAFGVVLVTTCLFISVWQLSAFAQTSQENLQIMVMRLKQANNISDTTVKNAQLTPSEDMNAATDGQQIIVTTRLWNTFKTDDQRAFVVAHELSHIVLGHIPKTQLRRVGFSLLDRIIANRTGTASSWKTLGNASFSLLDMKFSRGMEYQADELGVQLMTKAGYSPQGALEGFKILQANSGNAGPEFLQNHPLTESRVRSLAKKYGLKPS